MKLIARFMLLAVVVQAQTKTDVHHSQPRLAKKMGLARHPFMSAVELQTSEALVPPANVATTDHQKAKGGGYLEGSPLYGSTAIAGAVTQEAALPPIEPAGIFLPFFSLMLGIVCLVLVSLFNRGKGPVFDQEFIMRAVFEKCDLSGNGTVNKYDLVRSIRAHQADNAGSLDLDQALQRIDASIDLEISWNSFRALGVPNQTFTGMPPASRGRVMTMPTTMEPTPMDRRPVATSSFNAPPASYVRERSMTVPSSSFNAPLSVQASPPSVRISPPSVQRAPPSVQVQPGAPPSVQVQPGRSASFSQAPQTGFSQAPQTGGNWESYSASPDAGNWARRSSV